MKEKDFGVKWFNTIFYPNQRTARAVFLEEKIIPRLRQEEITLFTPWGPRYDWLNRGSSINFDDREIVVLKFLAMILQKFRENMPEKNFKWLFLGANLYGTVINKLPEGVVSQYFVSLESWLKIILPEAEFHLWSEFTELAERYRELVRDNFFQFVDLHLLNMAEKTAGAMGLGSNPKDYLVERLAEALFIEETFKPIKISCVGKYKDDKVDYQLPRLYFLSAEMWAPWL